MLNMCLCYPAACPTACWRGLGPAASLDYCNPKKESCSDIAMYQWTNKYYHLGCAPGLRVRNATLERVFVKGQVMRGVSVEGLDPVAETEVVGMNEDEMVAERKVETCKFTSKDFRDMGKCADKALLGSADGFHTDTG